MMGPHGELIYLSNEEFEKLISNEKESIDVSND
jgi:hypothetical protein